MKTKVEIFRRDTGEVVETQTVELKSFVFYWSMQANDTDFGWREVGEDTTEQDQLDEVVDKVRTAELKALGATDDDIEELTR